VYEALSYYLPPVLLPVFVPTADGEKLDASCTMKRTLSSATRPPFASVFVLVVEQVVKRTCCRVGLRAFGASKASKELVKRVVKWTCCRVGLLALGASKAGKELVKLVKS
jgi:hypothetical protein